MTDITERKTLNVALAESEARYRRVVEDQTEVISRVSEDGTVIFANDVYCRFFGRQMTDIIGSKWHPLAHPEDIPVIESQLRMLSPGNPVVEIENRVYSGKGELRWMHFVNRGIFDNCNRLVEVQSVGRDITDSKHWSETVSKLSNHLQSSIEEERTRISREIHDQLGSQLATLKLGMRWLSKHKLNKDDVVAKKIHALENLITETMQSVREISTQLRPSILDNLGLLPAIEWKLEQFKLSAGIDCEVILPADEAIHLSSDRVTAVYRILQESLTNIILHANADKVSVEIRHDGVELVIIITDNGIGIPAGKLLNTNSFGLIGMTERARHFGGMLNISGKADMGTVVELHMPLNDIPPETTA